MSLVRQLQAYGPAVALSAIACTAMAQSATKHVEAVAEDPKAPASAPAGKEIAVIQTKYGSIEIEFFDKDAPEHVKNFRKLARDGFYDGTSFHRVIPNFVVQGGDPNSTDSDPTNDGQGGPGYTIPAEIKQLHKRGCVAAARLPDQANPDKRSSGSQFYICLKDLPHLDQGGYSVFGRVTKGMDIVDKIAADTRTNAGKPKDPVKMVKVTVVTR